jgi:uncharacterized protein (TIGR00730 family)
MPTKPFTVCVYCGSRAGSRPDYREAAAALGRAIGERGWELVYGGGNVGLMGVVADAALAAGAKVCGVIPDSLMRREVGHLGLDDLLVVDTMHERKQAMAERADAFVAMPGGIGTLEEFFEVWTWRQLAYHQRPIALLNTAGYWDTLLAFLRQAVDEDFLAATQLESIIVADAVDAALNQVAAAAAAVMAAADLRRI